jgi:hypothetical protein
MNMEHKLLLDVVQRLPVSIVRDLLNRLVTPAIGRPTLGHHEFSENLAGFIHESPGPKPALRNA